MGDQTKKGQQGAEGTPLTVTQEQSGITPSGNVPSVKRSCESSPGESPPTFKLRSDLVSEVLDLVDDPRVDILKKIIGEVVKTEISSFSKHVGDLKTENAALRTKVDNLEKKIKVLEKSQDEAE